MQNKIIWFLALFGVALAILFAMFVFSRLTTKEGIRRKKEYKYSLYRPSKYVYRLGDMVSNLGQRVLHGGKSYHLKHFPNSIASEYLMETSEDDDYKTLSSIILKRVEPKDIPPDNTCVIHLRIGDVINMAKESAKEIAAKSVFIGPESWSNYTPCISQIRDGLQKLPKVSKIVIVAGSHKDVKLRKSYKYLSIIKRKLEKDGYEVDMRLGGDPDKDFIFMCMSPNFIASGGSYSKLTVNTRDVLETGASYETMKQ